MQKLSIRIRCGSIVAPLLVFAGTLTVEASTVALWLFDDPVGSAVATDSSGNGFHLTLGADAEIATSAKYRNCLRYERDAQTANVQVAWRNGIDGTALELKNDFTIEGWFRLDHPFTQPAGDNWAILFRLGHNAQFTNDTDLLMYREYFRTYLDEAISYDFAYNIVPGGWHHYALVRDVISGATGRYYVFADGQLLNSEPATFDVTGFEAAAAPSFSLFFLPGDNRADFVFPGSADEVRVSDTALYTANFNPPTSMAGSQGTWISAVPSVLEFNAAHAGARPTARTLLVGTDGSSPASWSIQSSVPWVSVSPASGRGAPVRVAVSVNPAGLTTGTHAANLSITALGAGNTPLVVPVSLKIVEGTISPFTDVSVAAGLGSTFKGNEPMAAWADYNNDGWPDLYEYGHLYRNDQGIGFSGVPFWSAGGTGIWGDYNNDGWFDLYLKVGKIMRNLAGQDFTQISLPPLPMGEHSWGGTWGDWNGDSWLDLYATGYENEGGPYHPDVIFLGNGNGAFTQTWRTPAGQEQPGRGVTTGDFDEDGDLDIYVSNYRLEANLLWRNNGAGQFTNAAPGLWADGDWNGIFYTYGHTIGSAWGDLDNDGHIDLFVGNFSHPPAFQDRCKVLRNLGPDGDWRLEDKSFGAGITWRESYASPALADFDNDGWLDLFLTTIYDVNSYSEHEYCKLYRNNGDWTFTDVTEQAGIQADGTYEAAWADYDGDGWLDLFTEGRLLRNAGGTNHWLKVRLVDETGIGNRMAVGAQVRIAWQGRTLTRQVETATGQINQNDPVLHFGLGNQADPVQLNIRWPDGKWETRATEVDRHVTISRGVTGTAPSPAITPTPTPVPENLIVAYWDFETRPGSTTVRDRSGNGFDLTLGPAGAITDDGVQGRCLTNLKGQVAGFNGQVAFRTGLAGTALDTIFSGNWTVEGWWRPNAPPMSDNGGSWATLFHVGRGNGYWSEDTIGVYHREMDGTIGSTGVTLFLDGAGRLDVATYLPPRHWTHVAVTFEAATRRCSWFQNGQLVLRTEQPAPTGGFSSANAPRLDLLSEPGDVYSPGANRDIMMFPGSVDEVRVSRAVIYTTNFNPSPRLTRNAVADFELYP